MVEARGRQEESGRHEGGHVDVIVALTHFAPPMLHTRFLHCFSHVELKPHLVGPIANNERLESAVQISPHYANCVVSHFAPRSLTLLIPLPLTALSPQIPSSLSPAPLPSSPASVSPLLPFSCAAFSLSPASPAPPSPARGKVALFTKAEEEREDSLLLLDGGDGFLLLDDAGDEHRRSSSPSTCKEERLPHVEPQICWSKECVKKPLQRQKQGRGSESDAGVVHGVVEAEQRCVLVQAAAAPPCASPSSSAASTMDCVCSLARWDPMDAHADSLNSSGKKNRDAYDSLDSGGNITIKCGVNGLKILSDYPPFILQPDWQILLNIFRSRNWNKGKHHMLRPD
ncbi:uncharacterized protein LOC119309326 [Triticum dicoccoides]|uniref:uncharacterized protein LOC119309326 n=1 Tax=Triticum dicoccoides TaxID=85692 RepID=UPI001890B7A4|nr:uncharacterized protein LOC119309326 [Triticum dicoccoides]